METAIDPLDNPELARAVQKIFIEANRAEEKRSIYFQGIVLTQEECQLLWEYLQIPRHGFWRYKESDEEE